MGLPPTYHLRDLGPQAQQAQDMANRCKDERLAVTLQCVAIGSMIVLAIATAAHTVRDLLRHHEHGGRSK